MSNNKQNSVQWLIEKYTIVCGLGSKELMKEHIDRAKAMHKDEIIKAMSVAFIDGAKIGGITYESPYEDWAEYYNETY